jgi:hypothetical protein
MKGQAFTGRADGIGRGCPFLILKKLYHWQEKKVLPHTFQGGKDLWRFSTVR